MIRKTEREIIVARERAQIKGGKILTILKGEMLNSHSFVHLKPTSESQDDMFENVDIDRN